MSVAEDPTGTTMTMIDEAYEFSAPRFFDFTKGESEEEMRKAELWFESALSYAPSPFMPRIKAERSFKVESLCNFSEAAEQIRKESESFDSTSTDCSKEMKHQSELVPAKTKEIEVAPSEATEENRGHLVNVVSADKDTCEEHMGETKCTQENGRRASSNVNIELAPCDKEKSEASVQVRTEIRTPKPAMHSGKGETDSKKQQTAKKIASLVKNPSTLRGKTQLQSSQAKRDAIVKKAAGTPTNFALENQAIKRQKLDGGRSRQILNVKPQNFPHKSKLGLTCSSSNLCTSTAKTRRDERKVYVREREPAAPFVSMAEMMRKFNSSTRDLSLPQNTSLSHGKPKLTLTRPKEPELETAQRIRSVRVKSTAELEEEMMAKIPKFKARPLNKKILEGPTLPAVPRSAPQPPEFQEFHLETMARANQHAETSSITSTEVSRQDNQWKPWGLTEPKSPVLQTLLRARPPKVKSSAELELEELEKAPKFKARALNKKIFESKGDLGISCTAKKHATKPQEFHFSINERIPLPAASIFALFEKLSLNSEPRQEKNPLPRNTKPNPFHLYTEERGAEKERKFVMELVQKQLEEERARIPKAYPYPYTTDYPVIPAKPEPKQCTRPEPFQLESLVRHEEEMQRELEERRRKEKEEAKMRMFKAQPVLREDPIPVPEKVRKPLTAVQEFILNLDHRAVERAEFDQKIKEKEMMYKRYREQSEAARMVEEEKALKQLRRTMVPHAKPLPKFDNPFCPQKSNKEITKAKSPLLRVLLRRERRKFITGVGTAISSATAHR